MWFEFILRLLLALGAVWTLVVFVLMLHEYGHIWAMNKVGIKPDMIVIGSVKLFEFKLDGVIHRFGIFPLMGYVASKSYTRAAIPQRAVVAVGGPLMSLVLGVMFIGFGIVTGNPLILICGKSSIFLAVTNIVPLPPMDGWPLLEWILLKRGIKVKEPTKKRLLAIGWTVIAATVVAAIV